jgi:hypothetical protein
MSKVKIAGQFTPEEALSVLFNASGPQGRGELQYMSGHTMTPEEAAKVLKKGSYVDYLEGRVIKVDFGNRFELDTTLYDRDNGEDAASTALFIELDRRKGGQFVRLNKVGVPFRFMESEVERFDVIGSSAYRYNDIMGGMLEVYHHVDIASMFESLRFSFFHPRLGNSCVSGDIAVESMTGHPELFNDIFKRVMMKAIDEIIKGHGEI